MAPSKPASADPPPLHFPRVARGWSIAGLIGLAVAITLVVKNPFGLGLATAALAAIAGGWATMLAFAPWKAMIAFEHQRSEILRLAADVRRITVADGDRPDIPLRLDRDDELGELSRALHETVARAFTHRREARLLQRRMDDSIRRETDRATMKLQREATTDPLTGLGNRRSLDAALDQHFGPDRRNNRTSLVAMVIDVDLFKLVNDNLGHEVGDECLAFMGTVLRSTLRCEDSAIRLGGDEFVVLMPNLTMEQGVTVAERVGALFGQMAWSHTRVGRPTLSIGLASIWTGDEDAAREIFRRADSALYASKEAGRNTIKTFQSGGRAA